MTGIPFTDSRARLSTLVEEVLGKHCHRSSSRTPRPASLFQFAGAVPQPSVARNQEVSPRLSRPFEGKKPAVLYDEHHKREHQLSIDTLYSLS
jgi:hypothetical protein